MKQGLFYILLFLMWPGFLAAREETTTTGGGITRKVCVYEALDITESSENVDQDVFKNFFKESMNLELKNAGFEIISEEKWKAEQQKLGYTNQEIIEGDKAMEVAAAAGADVVITMFYKVEKSRIIFGIKCYDAVTKQLAVSRMQNGRAGISISSTINEVIAEIIPLIKEKIQPSATVGAGEFEKEVIVEETVIKTEYEDIGKKVDVTLISGDEGADIFLVDENMGSITGGVLTVSVQAGRDLLLDIKKEGFHTRHQIIKVGNSGLKTPLKPLVKKTRWATHLEYSFFQFFGAGIGMRFYIFPDWWFLDLTEYPYIQTGLENNTKLVFHNDLGLAVGHYIYFNPEEIFRFNLYLGTGVILTTYSGAEADANFDFYSDILGVTFELNLPNVTLYFKESARYMFNLLGTGALESGWLSPLPMTLTFGGRIKW